MRVLGIETSCDETSAAVLEDGQRVLSNVVASQDDLHARYGGVVPEIASRAHLERLDSVVAEALERAETAPERIDAVAVAHRPGLIGSLLIGVTAAKTLAWVWRRPLVGVNHIHAHAVSAAMVLPEAPFPAVSLVASGGHTALYHVRGFTQIDLLGATTDDAAGEAFDKVASILGLGYPGGPAIDRAARGVRDDAIHWPRTMLAEDSLDFSFSGIKTAVLYHVHGTGGRRDGLARFTAEQIREIAASFQAAVVDVLVSKTLLAAERTGVSTVLVGGGVAANSRLRERLAAACSERGLALHLTPLPFCTDNGAMIAFLGWHELRAGRVSDLRLWASAS